MPAEIKEVVLMKLVGDLKDRVEKAENQEEAKKIIEEAGMELTDEEMDQVAGGAPRPTIGLQKDKLDDIPPFAQEYAKI